MPAHVWSNCNSIAIHVHLRDFMAEVQGVVNGILHTGLCKQRVRTRWMLLALLLQEALHLLAELGALGLAMLVYVLTLHEWEVLDLHAAFYLCLVLVGLGPLLLRHFCLVILGKLTLRAPATHCLCLVSLCGHAVHCEQLLIELFRVLALQRLALLLVLDELLVLLQERPRRLRHGAVADPFRHFPQGLLREGLLHIPNTQLRGQRRGGGSTAPGRDGRPEEDIVPAALQVLRGPLGGQRGGPDLGDEARPHRAQGRQRGARRGSRGAPAAPAPSWSVPWADTA
mmetsp:Transcript_86250/g.239158  ORF Transcript_86250/g.239158 Transcript_86250/m.239158 type:complete len:284 (+) Transcript_86250:711-1562(+)